MRTVILVSALVLMAGPARAQLELPRPSPLARVMQTVGLTEIEVEYSSPAARGRTVWGKLVPYGQHWRTGANANTLIRFSGPVEIGETVVPAGRYSLHTIPGEDSWTVIVNRKTDGGGSNSYDQSQDVLRFKVQVRKGDPLERMTFFFSDTTDSKTDLELEWAGVKIKLPILVDTKKQVDANIKRAVGGLWRAPAQAARYLVDNGRDLERALELADRSVAIKRTWFNLWIKARALAASGKEKEAAALTEEALKLGDESGAFRFYSAQMKAALKDWEG